MILTYICSKKLGKTMNLMAFECKDASKCTLIVFFNCNFQLNSTFIEPIIKETRSQVITLKPK